MILTLLTISSKPNKQRSHISTPFCFPKRAISPLSIRFPTFNSPPAISNYQITQCIQNQRADRKAPGQLSNNPALNNAFTTIPQALNSHNPTNHQNNQSTRKLQLYAHCLASSSTQHSQRPFLLTTSCPAHFNLKHPSNHHIRSKQIKFQLPHPPPLIPFLHTTLPPSTSLTPPLRRPFPYSPTSHHPTFQNRTNSSPQSINLSQRTPLLSVSLNSSHNTPNNPNTALT